MSRLAGVSGWVVAAILLAVLLWPKGSPVDSNSGALRAQNDSLQAVIEARGYREQRLYEYADSLARVHDSTLNNLPTLRVLYITASYAIRTSSLDSLWKFMGEWPADSLAR